jgi:hypothetical protein
MPSAVVAGVPPLTTQPHSSSRKAVQLPPFEAAPAKVTEPRDSSRPGQPCTSCGKMLGGRAPVAGNGESSGQAADIDWRRADAWARVTQAGDFNYARLRMPGRGPATTLRACFLPRHRYPLVSSKCGRRRLRACSRRHPRLSQPSAEPSAQRCSRSPTIRRPMRRRGQTSAQCSPPPPPQPQAANKRNVEGST